jgi:xanthine dehydrogenase molybdopterin-binding subunit B
LYHLQIFISSKVEYAGQPVGLIVAKTRDAAFLGATKVRVTYENIETPIVKIEESLEEVRKEGKMESLHVRTAKSPKKAVEAEPKHVISGKFQIGGQHHFQMEPHSTLCVPTENGLRVYSATQWIDNTQAMLSSALKLPVHKYGKLKIFGVLSATVCAMAQCSE